MHQYIQPETASYIISGINRLYNFEIRVGWNKTNFSENALCYYHQGVVGSGATEDFPCIPPRRGRFLSIQRLSPSGPQDKMLTICEIEVFQTGTRQAFAI